MLLPADRITSGKYTRSELFCECRLLFLELYEDSTKKDI